MTGLIAGMVRQRAGVILFAVLILGGGIISLGSIRSELFPNVSFGTITAITAYPGASPDRVAGDVTIPVESAVGSLPGVTKVTSVSYEGLSQVVLQYDYGTNLDAAESKINSALAGIPLPAGEAAPRVQQIDFTAFPVQIYSLRGLSLARMDALTRQELVPALTKVDGVAAADISGIGKPRVAITLDPAKLTRYGLTPAAVAQAIQGSNVALPAGAVSAGARTIPVEVRSRLTSLSAIGNLPVGTAPAGGRGAAGFGQGTTGAAPGGAGQSSSFGLPPARPGQGSAAAPHAVRLKDVARIVADSPSGASIISTDALATSGIVRTNGEPSLALSVRKNPEANIIAVADGISAAVAAFVKDHPGLHADVIYNGSSSVRDSLDSLEREGLLGAIFAILVIFLFLRSVRTTIVAAVSIPLSVLVALLLVARAGFTLNIMTLGGIAIAVGRVVDDSIVVLENIFRHRQDGEDSWTAVIRGTREVSTAIIGSTLTTVCVFLPIAFVGGILGQFFRPFALTVTFALLASLVTALTVVPALASLVLKVRPVEPRESGLQRAYTGALAWATGTGAHRAITLAVSFVLFIAAVGGAVTLPKSFFGGGSQPELAASLALPDGASIGATEAAAKRLEGTLKSQPGLTTSQIIIGYNANGGGGGGRNAANVATLTLRYKDGTDMERARARLETDAARLVPAGGAFTVQAVAAGPPNQGVAEFVSANDDATLRAAARMVRDAVTTVPGTTNVRSDLSTAKPQVYVDVDPARAARHGLSPLAVAATIRGLVAGQNLGTLRLAGDPVDRQVNLAVAQAAISSVRGLSTMAIVPGVLVSDVATVRLGDGPVQIVRYSQRNTATISADITGGNQGGVSGAVAAKVKALRLPAGASIETAGVYKEFVQGFINLGLALLAAIVLVYLVMVIIFRSLVHPLTILFSLPLAVIGASAALLITHRELDLSAGIGMLMLVGIVVTNAIVLLDLVLHHRASGATITEALIMAGRTRLRPILMTAVATILALAPLASGLSNGNTIIAANLATVVIGGLFTSTLLTLVVVPVVYSIFEGLRGRRTQQAEALDYDRLPAPASTARPADAPGTAR